MTKQRAFTKYNDCYRHTFRFKFVKSTLCRVIVEISVNGVLEKAQKY